MARAGHDQLRRFGELGVPSFAFVNGAAMGGGVELALHCTYRTISSGAAAVALPECFLGLVPGWGGTYLLPNLVGVPKALEVIITNPLNQNRMLKGPKAFELGLADAMFEPADFIEESLGWAARVLTGAVEVSPPRRRPRRRRPGTAPSRRPAPRSDARLHGAAPAPYRALDLIAGAAYGDPRRGVRRRGRGAGRPDLQRGVPQRASTRSTSCSGGPSGRPGCPDAALARPVTMVGRRRCRADGLAAGAALRPAARGAGRHDRPRPGPGRRRCRPGARRDRRAAGQGPDQPGPGQPAQGPRDRLDLDRGVRPGRLRDRGGLRGALGQAAGLRRGREGRLGRVRAGDEHVLACPCPAMASGLEHPERVVGFHFFNPVAVLPLVEVVRAEATDDASLATAFAVGKTLRKSCVLVKDAPAFVVNRLLTRFLGEVMASVDEGTSHEVGRGGRRSARPAAQPVRAAPAGRAGRGPARRRDHARGLSRTGSRVSANLGRIVDGRQAGGLLLGRQGPAVHRRRDPGADPAGRLAADAPTSCASGPCRPWPRRSG